MRNSNIEALNKVTIPIEGVFGAAPSVLWINAACRENRYTLNLKPHNHAFFEMHLIIGGSISYRFNDGEFTVSENSLIVISPHVIHCIPEESDDFQKVTVAFEIEGDGEIKSILEGKKKAVVTMNDDMKRSVDFIIRRAKSKSVCSELLIKNRLCELIYSVAESLGARPAVSSENYDTRVIKAKKYIEDNPHIFLTCDEVARYCNVSSKQLGRLFYQYEKISLLAFIHGQKIEDAKKLVLETDELFETISQRLGFSSVNYFGKFFAKHTSMTPGDFRKTFGNDHQ